MHKFTKHGGSVEEYISVHKGMLEVFVAFKKRHDRSAESQQFVVMPLNVYSTFIYFFTSSSG